MKNSEGTDFFLYFCKNCVRVCV